MDISARQSIEIDFWKNSKDEAPEVDSPLVLIQKMTEAQVLYDCLRKYQPLFEASQSVLELGAGQGWASCLVKRLHPHLKVTTTDISEWAVASLPKWERIFQVKVDDSRACRSYAIPAADDSLDLVFAFAAAHHFAAHRKTLAEIRRVLKPGGKCLYLYEPVCPRFFYKAAVWRVNRKRPEVPEDVIVTDKLLAIAGETGFSPDFDYYPSTAARRPFEMLYYAAQAKLPLLSRMLPSTANFVFTKR